MAAKSDSCVLCGGRIHAKQKRQPPKFCDTCRVQRRRERDRERYKTKRPVVYLELVCANCGTDFRWKQAGWKAKYCPACRERTRDRSAPKPEHLVTRSRRHHFAKTYGITLDERQQLLDGQDGKCAICLRSEAEAGLLQIDHDHSCCPGRTSCGRCLRGLICAKCNRALGLLDDDAERITTLIEYLTVSGKRMKR